MIVRVEVAPPYEVEISPGLLDRAGEHVREAAVALISDETVAPLYLARVREGLEHRGARVLPLVVPGGEGAKTLATYGELQRRLVRARLDRGAAVVALGGGVVGDLAGFVAATFLRGVAFYNLPTSLLAMVDAAVGGKTGVNLPEGKNLVGAFWQPRRVLMDVSALATLPEALFREGAVELYKHGLLGAPELLGSVTDPRFRRDGDPGFLEEVVAASVAVKARVVAGDEREAGARAHLNLGHTLAHALEAVTEGRLPHGQAVAYGLLYNARLAALRGWADRTEETRRFLRWVSPAPLPRVAFGELEPFLDRDKKNANGRRRFVLLRDVGEPVVVDDVPQEAQERAWEELREVLS